MFGRCSGYNRLERRKLQPDDSDVDIARLQSPEPPSKWKKCSCFDRQLVWPGRDSEFELTGGVRCGCNGSLTARCHPESDQSARQGCSSVVKHLAVDSDDRAGRSGAGAGLPKRHADQHDTSDDGSHPNGRRHLALILSLPPPARCVKHGRGRPRTVVEVQSAVSAFDVRQARSSLQPLGPPCLSLWRPQPTLRKSSTTREGLAFASNLQGPCMVPL